MVLCRADQNLNLCWIMPEEKLVKNVDLQDFHRGAREGKTYSVTEVRFNSNLDNPKHMRAAR
jgi:hypothetical protein